MPVEASEHGDLMLREQLFGGLVAAVVDPGLGTHVPAEVQQRLLRVIGDAWVTASGGDLVAATAAKCRALEKRATKAAREVERLRGEVRRAEKRVLTLEEQLARVREVVS